MEHLQAFESHLIEEERSRLTVEKYLRDVRKFLSWLGERALTKAELLSYKSGLLSDYEISSVNSMLSSLNRYLAFVGHPDWKLKILKRQRQVFCAQEKELTKQEYQRLLQAAESKPQLCLLMQTICATGIRVSEHPYITVEAARQGRTTVRCKGKHRVVFIPQKLCRALLKYAKAHRITAGSIFITSGGKPLDRSRIWAEMKKLCATAGVARAKVFPHNLRHLFARTYYSIEKDIVRLADILGHASINTTRIYTMESGDIHRRQIEKMKLLYIT